MRLIYDCDGAITHYRKLKNREEKAVLDYFIVCDKVLPYITKMNIDEKRVNVLTKFSNKKGGKNIKKSDHNPLTLDLKMNYIKKEKSVRQEYFDFKIKRAKLCS